MNDSEVLGWHSHTSVRAGTEIQVGAKKVKLSIRLKSFHFGSPV